ncbi:unnamed protein product [Schistocephalus solidus]|uniref:Uncharacterized protein n=1 Tax=Schistocephalus solidus TaxID=70667 RepID=A0A183SHL8_SCHSO|nr:unnamed protein product [Schistocephalus solidus]
MRKRQDTWMLCKTKQIQGYADHNEWRKFFDTIKALCGLTAKGTVPLLSANETTLLSENTQIPKRILKASSVAPPPSLTPPWTDCFKQRPTPTLIFRTPFKKPSGP